MLVSQSEDRISQFIREVETETARIATNEPQELYLLRTGTMANRAGSYGQYFGTWDIAHGMLRDFSMYSLYPLLRVARNDPNANLAMLCEELFEPYTNYLGYSGMPTLERFGLALRAIAKDSDNATIERCLTAYLIYANRLYSWAYHYFPWDLGEQFRYPDGMVEEEHGGDSATGAAAEVDGPLIRMTWKELDISVKAVLAASHNPELCADFLEALPFTILQQHPMVSGKSLFAWAPMASTAPIRYKEEIRRAPVGRLRFSQRTGQKLIVQYGPTTETIMAPVLGTILPEYLDELEALGQGVWDSTYHSKKQIWLTVERID